MGKPIIKILDTVHCQANKHARPLILPALRYKQTVYKRKRGGFGKETNVVTSHLITGRTGTKGHFLTGLLPRVKSYCKKRGIKIDIQGKDNLEVIKPTGEPEVEGITFRGDQLLALVKVSKKHRGRIVFPTGSGKTIIALGIRSMFKDCPTLFLCHTKDLLRQSYDVFSKHHKNVFMLGDGHKPKFKDIKKTKNPILCSTIQSFVKWDIDSSSIFFDLLMVDEMHHVNSLSSQYGKILQLLLAPRRYGLTATIPTKQHEVLINEGLFGPTIAEFTLQEAEKTGITAKVNLNLLSVPYDTAFNKKCKTYKEYYEFCIVKNRARNILLTEAVDKFYKDGKSSLIIVEKIEHGKRIVNMLRRRCGIKAPFVYGGTNVYKRDKVKKLLSSKKKKAVVCSRIWKEGINIPSLDHIVNAVGLKEEKGVLQAVGRGLRTTEEKSEVTLTDFLDPYKWLSHHSIMRIQVYQKEGWL